MSEQATLFPHLCQCQDSKGIVCNTPMSAEEATQDGMCSFCADNVWHEMTSISKYKWFNKDNPKRKETK